MKGVDEIRARFEELVSYTSNPNDDLMWLLVTFNKLLEFVEETASSLEGGHD